MYHLKQYQHTYEKVTYDKYLVIWTSRIQIEIALSTKEAEYIALSQSMRDVLPFVSLMKYI